MNKKLIPLAVAAAMAAPAAAMADATIYGKLHMSLDYVNVDEFANWFYAPTSNQGRPRAGCVDCKFDGWGLNTNPRSSRVGLKGSEDLGNGLKAIYQVEFGVPLSNEDSNIANGDNSGIKMRNSYIGLASSWGTVLTGRHDTPLKMSTGALDLFSDTLADYNWTVGFQDIRADSVVAYISPNWSGLTFAGAIIPTAGATATGIWNQNNDSIASGWSAALTYANGPFYASAAFEQLNSEMWNNLPGSKDMNTYSFGLGLMNYSGFTLTGVYENQSSIAGVDGADNDMWQIQAMYAFGNNDIKAMYGQALPNSRYLDYDKNTWAIGLDHNFSKRTSAYMLYTQVNDDLDNADWSGFSIGMIHNF